jgi:hypothetical protein
MALPRSLLVAALLAAAGWTGDLAAQSAQSADGLGTARGCTRSRIGIAGSVAPVTAASHTFLGRFVGSFGRFVQPGLRDVRGRVQIGLGGSGPLAVRFSMKRPVSQPLLPEQREDRLTPEQHRALFASIKGALREIQGVPTAPVTVTLRIEGGC